MTEEKKQKVTHLPLFILIRLKNESESPSQAELWKNFKKACEDGDTETFKKIMELGINPPGEGKAYLGLQLTE